MEADVSNKTIVVLVVLTVIISVLSTLVVLNEVNNINIKPSSNYAQKQTPDNHQGYVSLNIVEPKPDAITTSGKVVLEVK